MGAQHFMLLGSLSPFHVVIVMAVATVLWLGGPPRRR